MSPAQQEQLLQVGVYLQGIRKEQGKAVDEVANQIFIRPALLRAIETGDWESLPEPVFVHGFIRRYADYLGLDGREVAKQFEPTPVSVLPDPELANTRGMEGVVKPQDKHSLKVLSKAEAPQSSSTTSVRQARPVTLNKWGVGLGAIAILLGGSIWFISRGVLQTATSTPTAETTPNNSSPAEDALEIEPGEPADSAAASAEATADNAEAATSESTGAPITFQVNLEGDSWMRVTVDGEEVYEGILTSGTQQSWTAQSELTVKAGNSGVVLYSFNGGDALPLGAPGAVSDLTLTPDMDPQALQP